MIWIECEQGSQEWLDARAGAITASRCRDALDTLKSGKPSQKSLDYQSLIACEIIAGQPLDDTFVTYAMRRGTELEPEAREVYEVDTGRVVSESGFALSDCRRFGYSADGLVDDDGLLEIKCPLSAYKIIQMWRTADLSEYIHQIQMGLWLTGREWLDFVMYAPQLGPVKKDIFLRRVERDEAFIVEMVRGLEEFHARVMEDVEMLRADNGK